MTDPIEERKAFMRYIMNAEAELHIRNEHKSCLVYDNTEWIAMYANGMFIVNNYAGYNLHHHIYKFP